MDIFTTALIRVRTSPIKPDKLKVKALHKDSATRELKKDSDHLEDHQLYFVNEEDQEGQNNNSSSNKQKKKEEQDVFEQNILPTEAVITDKKEILHPETAKSSNAPDGDIKHLDLFI